MANDGTAYAVGLVVEYRTEAGVARGVGVVTEYGGANIGVTRGAGLVVEYSDVIEAGEGITYAAGIVAEWAPDSVGLAYGVGLVVEYSEEEAPLGGGDVDLDALCAEPAWWLVDAVIDGATYRYAATQLEVPRRDGTLVLYRPGLVDLEELEFGAEDVDLAFADSGVDWVTLAGELAGGAVEVRRWIEGTKLEDARLYSSGFARDLEHGTRDELVSFTSRYPETSTGLGLQTPDALATINNVNWSLAGTIVDEGDLYPLVFGYPIFVPVPVLSWQAGPIISVIISAGIVGASTVTLRDDETGQEATRSVTQVKDQAGRSVAICTVLAGQLPNMTTADDAHRMLATFSTDEGAGVATTLFECVDYLLTRFGPDTVDWARFRGLRDDLAGYRVDTWIDSLIESPWDWIEAIIGDLPFEIRTGDRGRYFVRQRHVPTGNPIRAFEAGVDAVRLGGRRLREGDINEFTALYRPGKDSGQWLNRVTVTSERLQSAPSGLTIPVTTATQVTKIVADARCSRSYSRWGLGQSDAVEIDWTTDLATALQILDWRVDRDAVDAWESEYALRCGHDLDVGDEVLLTDADLGLVDEPALVMAAPVADRGPFVTTVLRYAR